MNYNEIEEWVRTNITKNGNFSLKIFLKREKIFESKYSYSRELPVLVNLNQFLKKIVKSLNKVKNINSVYWFKVNLVDNAFSDLVGLGEISCLNDIELISSLLKYDVADQAGDVIVAIFDETKEWLIKITNDQEENKVYVRLYGKGKIIELLKQQQI